jgi:hypothetical protein
LSADAFVQFQQQSGEKREFIDSRDEMERFLREEGLGYLGLTVDGKPYIVPLNYSYDDGKILFHCALEGKKMDAIRANPNVCFAVGTQAGAVRRHPEGQGDVCHVDSDSVICYGTARIVNDLEERAAAINSFNRSFRPRADDVPMDRVKNCGVVEITVSEMTGRRERARKRTLWRHVFESL